MRLLSRRSVADSRTARSCDRKFQTTLNLHGRPRRNSTRRHLSEGSALPSLSIQTGHPPCGNSKTGAPARVEQAGRSFFITCPPSQNPGLRYNGIAYRARKSVGVGKGVEVRVALGGRRNTKQKKRLE